MPKMCFNRKVLAGLAAAAVGLFLVAPHLFGRALPVLVLAACPLSMVMMMRSTRGARGGAEEDTPAQSSGPVEEPTTHAEVARLRSEIDQLRAELNGRSDGAGFASRTPPTRAGEAGLAGADQQ